MSDNDTVYLRTDGAFTAVQISSDMAAFCTSFNSEKRLSSVHVWFDGEHIRLEGAPKDMFVILGSPGDWIITSRGNEKIISDHYFSRFYMPVSRSVLRALEDRK